MLEPTTQMLLARHACLATSNVEQARAHLSALFWPHQLSLNGPVREVNFRHNLASCGGLSLNALRYGHEVAIRVAPSSPAYLIKFTLAGTSEVVQHTHSVVSRTGMVCVMNPSSRFTVRLSADHNQLTLRVDGLRLQRFLAAELGYRPRMALEFLPVARTCRNETPGLGRIIRTLCEDLDDTSAFAQHAVVRHVEETLFGLLLAELPHNYSEPFNRGVDGDSKAIARIRDFIDAHLREPLSLNHLARSANISARGLQQAFQQHLGTAPMAYVRDRRLELARAELLRDHCLSVTDIALSCGFTHLSRFARYYRERFGETPHATVRQH